MASDPFDSNHLIGHVKDADYFEVPRALDKVFGADVGTGVDGVQRSLEDGKLFLPQIRDHLEPLVNLKTGIPRLDEMIEPLELKFTKFMALEVLGVILIGLLFIGLANRMRKSDRPRGRIWNMLESMLLFIRDDIARPAIGHHADHFLPFLWTIFFFVLACNLLGMVPCLGSPTGALATTGALALLTFMQVVVAGSKELGVVGFWKAQVPHMDLPGPLAIFLKPMVFVIELLGLLIKHFVLAVRLLANMMAGHLVLAVLLAFIAAAWGSTVVWGVAPATIFGATALSLLELFVAFLQAYIFTFLSALFIGMAVHPH
jgi:F-type H+-transporting ATPase subunit a